MGVSERYVMLVQQSVPERRRLSGICFWRLLRSLDEAPVGNFGTQVRIGSPFGALTDDDAEIGRQAVYMVLNTRRGTYYLDPEYGFLISDLCNAALTTEAVSALPAEIEAAVLHLTDIVSSCQCRLLVSDMSNPQGVQLKFRLDVEPNTGGPWSFNVDVSALSAEVLRSGI